MRWLPGPYPLRELSGVLWRRIRKPPPWAGRSVSVHLRLRDSPPARWIGFVGDICPLHGRMVSFGAGVRAFLNPCELVVGNFEGVLSARPRSLLTMRHRSDIFGVLSALKPLDRWVLSVANNHAADDGEAGLGSTLDAFDRRGIRWLGTHERPRLALPGGLTVTTWTWWTNRATCAVACTDPGAPTQPGLHVAFPHWGYEHERAPRADQRARVPAGYDLVAGHHSHLPHSLKCLDGRPVAWSLGNFVTGKTLAVLGEGALLKIGLAYDAPGAAPVLTDVHYRALLLDRSDPAACRVVLRPSD